MPLVRMITGTARTRRADRINALLTERLEEVLLVVPTNAYARRRAAGVLRASGRVAMLDPPVITFRELAQRMLRGSEFQPTSLGPLEQRILLRRAITQARAAGALDTLGTASESEGFLDHVLSVIGQLKQAAIDPTQFRKQVRPRKHAMDAIVAEVYARYQDELQRAGTVDLQGLYWLARIACQDGARPPELKHLRRLLFDDFDDFTPSEFQVIRALAGHVDELVFGLNLSDDPQRKTLYALPLATRDALRDEFQAASEEPCDEPAPVRTTEFIAASLLVRADVTPPSDLREDIEFVECHTLEHEMEVIARRIKYLVRTENVPLPRIAVVWRNTASIAAPMREVFREFGIPLSGLEQYKLADSAVWGFVLRFLNAAQSWSPEAVLDVLTAPWFSATATHADVFPILVRAARVRPTRQGWSTSTERLAQHIGDPRTVELRRVLMHVPRAKPACAELQEFVTRFAAQSELCARAKSVTAHAQTMLALLEQWPLFEAIAAMPPGEQRDLETVAVRELVHTLELMRDLHATDTARIGISAFAQSLRSALTATPLSIPTREGGVVCLGMEPARYLSFEHVFLAGLTDEHAPAGRKLSAIYSDDDRAALDAAGVPLDHPEIHSRREILLFQRMFGIATRRLTISWHRLAVGGKSVQRSLYLNEVADRMGGLRAQTPSSSLERFTPAVELAGCLRDAQNLAVVAGDAAAFPSIAAAAAVEQRRYGFTEFDAHDGVLADTRSLAWLREHYGAAHVFSASQLESYVDCPFRFFQDRVLDLLVIDPAEQVFDTLARGLVLHDALQQFHTRYRGQILPGIPLDEAAAAMLDCAGAAFDRVASQFRHLPEGVLIAERARTAEILLRYIRIQSAPNKRNAPEAWPPDLFEVTFGRAVDTSGPAFALDTVAGRINLSGRIDRIDRIGNQFRLIDYKSSVVAAKPLNTGKLFQLALYALAAEAVLLHGERCADAMYIAIGHDKNPRIALSRSAKDKADWNERIALAHKSVAEAVLGIRAGRFHPTLDKNSCRGCTGQKVCRFERARIRRKAAP